MAQNTNIFLLIFRLKYKIKMNIDNFSQIYKNRYQN